MKTNTPIRHVLSQFRSAISLVLCLWTARVQAQHFHLNAGSSSPEQNAPLSLVNAPQFDTNAAYNVFLTLANSGPSAGLYQGAGVTFTALPSTLDNGGPAPGHAAEGAFLQLECVSVSGPAGGVFSLWMQQPGDATKSDLLFSLPVGTNHAGFLLPLSESDGSPGSDPYGHIHGRTFTADLPGLYVLGCRVVDTSTNGVAGGPIHSPSDIFYFYFQAGTFLSATPPHSGSMSLFWGTTVGQSYTLESSPDLNASDWTPIAGPFDGDNHLALTEIKIGPSQLFFRLRSDSSEAFSPIPKPRQ